MFGCCIGVAGTIATACVTSGRTDSVIIEDWGGEASMAFVKMLARTRMNSRLAIMCTLFTSTETKKENILNNYINKSETSNTRCISWHVNIFN